MGELLDVRLSAVDRVTDGLPLVLDRQLVGTVSAGRPIGIGSLVVEPGRIHVVLPVPPSGNRGARRGRGSSGRMMHTAPEVLLYRRGVDLLLCRLRCPPLHGPVEVRLAWHRKIRQGDLDNRVKTALDAVRGRLFLDDEQVIRIVAERFEDRINPRIDLEVLLCPR